MSADFSVRPIGAPAPSTAMQPLSAAVENAVATELPAAKSVTAVDAVAPIRNDALAQGDVSHQAVIDTAAASIVYQVIDNKTQLVVDQYPDDATLRRRAYFHALDLAKSAPNRRLATDRTA